MQGFVHLEELYNEIPVCPFTVIKVCVFQHLDHKSLAIPIP